MCGNHGKKHLVLGYGSLLNVDSLRRTLPQKQTGDLRPVRVVGFRRLFNLIMLRMAPRFPGLKDQPVGALNIIADPDEELGAVAFWLTAEEQVLLDRREYCYFKISGIPVFDFYTGESVGTSLLYSVYPGEDLARLMPEFYREKIGPLGVGGILSPDILPGDDYLTLCLQGAFSWGGGFGEHFIDHTYLADGQVSLRDYLGEDEVKGRLEMDVGTYLRGR